MNSGLQTDILNKVVGAVSASTEHVFYYYLPSADLLDCLTVVLELNNTSVENTFDKKEVEKLYTLQVKMNAPTSTLFQSNSIYINNAIYDLQRVNEHIGNVSLISETMFWDSELEVFTHFQEFEITYH